MQRLVVDHLQEEQSMRPRPAGYAAWAVVHDCCDQVAHEMLFLPTAATPVYLCQELNLSTTLHIHKWHPA